MKKSDIILIVVILLVAGVSYLIFNQMNKNSELIDGTAVVYYNRERVLEIYLEDGTYKVIDESRIININESTSVFHVLGSNPYGVYIEYKDNQVSVIDEESPKNICQYQGPTNSPLKQLKCLPNNVVFFI